VGATHRQPDLQVWRPDLRTIGPHDESEHNTIVVERSDGLWRALIHPDQVQTFGSRELAVAHAEQLAFSRVPAST